MFSSEKVKTFSAQYRQTLDPKFYPKVSTTQEVVRSSVTYKLINAQKVTGQML